jgi:hypothetical protein
MSRIVVELNSFLSKVIYSILIGIRKQFANDFAHLGSCLCAAYLTTLLAPQTIDYIVE